MSAWLFLQHGIIVRVLRCHQDGKTRLLVTMLLVMTAAGCTQIPIREATLVENERGAVYLERVRNADFHAEQPIELDMVVIGRAFSGVYVVPRQSPVTTFVFGHAAVASAFLSDDIAFLAPAILRALKQATSKHAIGFRVYNQVGSGSETTAGQLYVEKGRLILTLTQYRIPIDPVSKVIVGPDVMDPTGLNQREVRFQPDVAVDHEAELHKNHTGYEHLPTLVINYNRLARLPESELGHAGQAPLSQTATTQNRQKSTQGGVDRTKVPTSPEGEIGLQQEIQTLKRQLAEQEAEIQRLRAREQELKNQTTK